MTTENNINALEKLGDYLQEYISSPNEHELKELIKSAYVLNNWFTEENTHLSIGGIISFLKKDNLNNWIKNYPIFNNNTPKRVAIIMAGNIPMVGFHDFLAVLISGHTAVIKLSSDDRLLLPFLTEKLISFAPELAEKIIYETQLTNKFDAVIATGSNNSARYFEQYFSKHPNIIRKNRNSVAVITKDDSPEDLKNLGKDIFQYFGLGCRSVSKIFLPKGYKIDPIYEAIFDFKPIFDHNKYGNNYNYNRTILLMQAAQFYDNNFLIFKEDDAFKTPISIVNISYYNNLEDVKKILAERDEEIQCVVAATKNQLHSRQVSFGDSQSPSLTDYADGVDTLDFLCGLTSEK